MRRGSKKSTSFDEKALKKGELRKLNALRKSLGPDIANRAFAQWLTEQPAGNGMPTDKAAERIADELMRLVEREGLQIPRGGYIVRRGRGRVIVEQAAAE